jgi:hypothetical protein
MGHLDAGARDAGESKFDTRVTMLAFLFIVLAVLLRFLPHPFSFTTSHWWFFAPPVASALLFFGARGSKRQLWAPFLLLTGSDIVLNRFVYHQAFSADQFVVWVWYAAMLWLGTGLSDFKPLRIAGAAFAAPISFFIVSNFAVWASGTMYARSVSGLVHCFTLAVPFFRNQFASDLIFTAVMFGIGFLVEDRLVERKHVTA